MMTNTDDHTDDVGTPIKIAHLVVGLLFLGIVALVAIVSSGTLPWSQARYLWPSLLIGAGLAGLGASAFSARRTRIRSRKPPE